MGFWEMAGKACKYAEKEIYKQVEGTEKNIQKALRGMSDDEFRARYRKALNDPATSSYKMRFWEEEARRRNIY